MFDRISCVAVYVGDMKRAKAFYTEVLGFRVSVDLGPELSFLESPSGKMMIYFEGGHEPLATKPEHCRTGFFLEAVGSVHELHQTLKNAGVVILEDAPEQVGDDTFCFAFRDPDGNIIEVSGKP